MAKIEVNQTTLATLRDKTVLITGGSNGIGRQTGLLLHSHGANVVIGDLDVVRGESLLREIGEQGIFEKTDVTNWESLRNLFERAKDQFGSVDIVLANAGIPERPPYLFDVVLDDNGLLKEPDFCLVDINLNGVLRSIATAHLWICQHHRSWISKVI
ncbi:uncharacterized protein A1O9_06970 [Exophiala aquamarina CBS 119918]|uniref:3-oxoacyl-[acyl-carrier protein] reductase n=1 Tax=Exophiala aquamarina CBS 119918 TaxID=1182545 RepID=A0A072PMQ8_9EURO|nr:uncharacterized protein A1O9_06970 [Exophiala aquamarina CBS 119918]KEF56780.1 hypothetical protein A1O9_06970 [Exophiala aquamarina CBS 119918]